MSARDKAVELMTHYFKLIAQKAGVNWQDDCNDEIELLVDKLIAAAVDEMPVGDPGEAR